MPVTDADVVNQALQIIGNNMPKVTGVSPTFDQSTAGKAAQEIYAPTVAMVGRLFEWDMARRQVTLTLSANGSMAPLWTREYLYPTNGIEVWQLVPSVISDPFDPLPVNWTVGNRTVSGEQRKVIWTDLAGAIAVYNNNPGPDVWDPLFREAVERHLASKFAMAVAGRPDTAQALLASATAFVSAAVKRDD